jgi:hypothetical protein
VDYTPALNAEKIADNEFQAVKAVLSTPTRAFIYIVGLVALGIHLSTDPQCSADAGHQSQAMEF